MKNLNIFRFGALLCLLTLTISSSFAERVSKKDAAVVASNFMNAGVAQSGTNKASAKKLTLKKSAATAEQAQYYVYENPDGGWVLVAANDAAYPILAYSKTIYMPK